MRIPLILFLILLVHQPSNAQDFAIIKSPKSAKYKWLPEWNNYVAEEIINNREVFLNDKAVPKADINELCPGYFKASEHEKIAFWVLLVASVSYFESGFKPGAMFKEPPSLNGVYSEGLLQLSYIDKLNHKDLDLYIDIKLKNIHDPKANLQSGVKILAKQLKKRKVLFTSKSYYWSVLTKKKKEIIDFFNKHGASFSFCK